MTCHYFLHDLVSHVLVRGVDNGSPRMADHFWMKACLTTLWLYYRFAGLHEAQRGNMNLPGKYHLVIGGGSGGSGFVLRTYMHSS